MAGPYVVDHGGSVGLGVAALFAVVAAGALDDERVDHVLVDQRVVGRQHVVAANNHRPCQAWNESERESSDESKAASQRLDKPILLKSQTNAENKINSLFKWKLGAKIYFNSISKCSNIFI